ncbi:MAG TPA: caspase family protein, partial [Dongiaceae bacterium]
MLSRMLSIVAGLCLLGQGLIAHSAEAEPRVALVIGNSNYGKEIGSLPNPANDAGLIAQALQQAGFQVIKVVDADQKKMKRAIADFGDKLAAAGPEATGLFFYAGHGVQVRGMNYLVPIGADISKEADVDIESVSADTILQQMEFAGSRVNIVILDACRNNPLGRSVRSLTRGLAPMDATQGTFVAYSTAPGQVASDGSGRDSPYSAALAK